jgi:uncharacterized protein with PIN domain
MSIEYTFEYKEYDNRELYYILENGEKVVDFWDETYMALYIDRRRREYNVTAIKNAKDQDKLFELLIDMMINYLDIDNSYKVCTFCSTEIDRYYGYKIRERIYESTKEE